MNARQTVHIEPMALADIPQVVEIDRLSFPLPWSASAYRYELTSNRASHLIVAFDPADRTQPGFWARLMGCPPARKVVGYAGFWFIVDEAHISTIAVRPAWRRRGLGELLLVTLLQRALDLGAVLATLEVRVSNQAAQNLYRKYGFVEVGRRKHYYRDNNEDALLLTVEFDSARREQVLARSQPLQSAASL